MNIYKSRSESNSEFIMEIPKRLHNNNKYTIYVIFNRDYVIGQNGNKGLFLHIKNIDIWDGSGWSFSDNFIKID